MPPAVYKGEVPVSFFMVQPSEVVQQPATFLLCSQMLFAPVLDN